MEKSRYLEGGELFDEIVKRGCMNEKDAAFIIKQVLSAITYCHSKGVVHRDLKPENILIDFIDEDGRINIKVIDFGAALFISPQDKISETFGTAYYMAPEVLKEDYNEKCDVWSIGAILFILLSGEVPFDGETDKEITDNIKKGEYSLKGNSDAKPLGDIWDSVSEDAKDLVAKMLTYDPNERISAAKAYQHKWLHGKDFSELTPKRNKELNNNLRDFYVHQLK